MPLGIAWSGQSPLDLGLIMVQADHVELEAAVIATPVERLEVSVHRHLSGVEVAVAESVEHVVLSKEAVEPAVVSNRGHCMLLSVLRCVQPASADRVPRITPRFPSLARRLLAVRISVTWSMHAHSTRAGTALAYDHT